VQLCRTFKNAERSDRFFAEIDNCLYFKVYVMRFGLLNVIISSSNSELRTLNSELYPVFSELRTPNSELYSVFSELRTPNSELHTN
jgi:hypothetical protein